MIDAILEQRFVEVVAGLATRKLVAVVAERGSVQADDVRDAINESFDAVVSELRQALRRAEMRLP